MNLETRLERHLAATADELAPAAGDVETIVRRGARRRLVRRTTTLAATAAAAAVFVVVAVLLFSGGQEPNVVDSVPPPPTGPEPTSTVPGAVPVPTTPDAASPAGVLELNDVVIAAPFDGGLTIVAGEQTVTMGGDRYFDRVRDVAVDAKGGMVYILGPSPLSWGQGAVVRLAPGATEPTVLMAGTAPGAQETRRLAGPLGEGVAVWEAGSGPEPQRLSVTLLRPDGTTSLVADLTFDPVREHLEAIDSAGSTLALATSRDGCQFVTLIGVDGTVTRETELGCDETVSALAVSPDGDRIVTVQLQGDSSEVRLIDTTDGSVLQRVGADAWEIEWRSESSVVVVHGTNVQILDFVSGAMTRTVAGSGPAVWTADLTINPAARLGTGEPFTGCEPAPPPPAATSWQAEAPAAVVDTWTSLRALASSCDYDGLDELARRDGTFYAYAAVDSIGDAWIPALAFGFDPRATLLQLTSLEPAQAPDGSWVWPAAAVTGAEADWQALVDVGVVDPDEAEFLQTEGDYFGMVVAIDADGRWVTAVTGE